MQKRLCIYRSKEGKQPFTKWLESIQDKYKAVSVQIDNRLNRVALGNYGDYRSVGSGVYELRIHYGGGYRIYFTEQEETIVLLLMGGNKKTQRKDIQKAKQYWQDFRERCYD